MLGGSKKPQRPVSQATMRSKKEYFLSSSTIIDPNVLEYGQLENLVGKV